MVPDSCEVGPYSTIGPDVVLGEECRLISHVVLDGHTRIGARNVFYPFCSVGMAPQDLKYGGEPTQCEIGDDNTIRECVTISRGTVKGGGITRVGSKNLLMAYVHIGHDCIVGNGCILANAATLAGHVIIEDFATLGAFSPVHQFCTVGKYAFIGGGTIVTQDVLPFSLTSARRENKAFGINKIGLAAAGILCGAVADAAEGVSLPARGEVEYLAGAREDSRDGGRGCEAAGGLHREEPAGRDQVAQDKRWRIHSSWVIVFGLNRMNMHRVGVGRHSIKSVYIPAIPAL